ncbi:MAG TPA: hypothetical protein VHP14_23430 [Anaerolineales bacterium]|nr:hypothetical protein [Anaerolineales bacterium]
MPGVFDRLQKEIENKESEGGITALDIADLPPTLRKIMRLMLRELQLGYRDLMETVAALPEKERLAAKDLEEALTVLTRQGWLIRIGQGEKAIYKVNLRRKAGAKLATGIWNTLDEKLKGNPSGDPPTEAPSPKPE